MFLAAYFTSGRILFMIFFIISFLILAIYSYKKDLKSHKIHYPNSIEAYTEKGVVWIKPIKIPFARFYKMKNYHIADYNLYWINIRNNLKYRLKENGY